jgi:predicted regulator of Ras-like GTPase activity (Roadblock/LC7/MglB family)
MIEPAIALYGPSYQKALRALEGLIEASGIRWAMLLDRQGFVLAHKEALWAPQPPGLDSLATLLAGSAAATQALAKLLGEARFREFLQQGENLSIYVQEVGELAFLVSVFDASAPLGRVKVHAERVAQELEAITKEAKVEPTRGGIDTEYCEQANALLDELFGGS